MTYDVAAVRAQFPALDSGVAAFDGPGGTQTPRSVIDAIATALSQPLSNRGTRTDGERNADRIVADARAAMADLVGAEPQGIVFGRSSTQLTYDLSRTLAHAWGPGDEVVVSRLDHDANVRPWIQAAERVGATVRWIDFDPATAELALADVESVLSDRTRLVAVTAASNLVGTRPDIAAIARAVHDSGGLVHVDAVHACAHCIVDLDRLGIDSMTCSPYKFLGPHLGVLAARPDLLESLHPDKLAPATDAVPERFELGTLPYELLAGTSAAVDFLAGLDPSSSGTRRERLAASFDALAIHEDDLRSVIEAGLGTMASVRMYSRAARRTPTLLLTFDGRDPVDAYTFLAQRGIAAPAGTFYAQEPSRHLGLGDTGGLRIGLAPYNDRSDVERLLTALDDFISNPVL